MQISMRVNFGAFSSSHFKQLIIQTKSWRKELIALQILLKTFWVRCGDLLAVPVGHWVLAWISKQKHAQKLSSFALKNAQM